jgi:hypothetical protein
VAGHDVGAVVRGTVVDDDHLEIAHRLRGDRVQGLGHERRAVVDRHDHGDQR